MKKILFIGCSNLVNDTPKDKINYPKKFKADLWKEIVFGEDVEIINLSWRGVGNQFITGNLFDYLEEQPTPDYVYLQFSGLCRFDIPTNLNYDINYDYHPKTFKRRWLCSGGKIGSWLGNDKTNIIFLPLYWNDNEYQHVVKESLQSVSNAINLLESKNIKYNWTFYYNILKPSNNNVDSFDGHIDAYPSYINRSKMISIDPHTYCFQNNGLMDDGCHFHNAVYGEWLKTIKSELTF